MFGGIFLAYNELWAYLGKVNTYQVIGSRYLGETNQSGVANMSAENLSFVHGGTRDSVHKLKDTQRAPISISQHFVVLKKSKAGFSIFKLVVSSIHFCNSSDLSYILYVYFGSNGKPS